jgi:hypothetical protein
VPQVRRRHLERPAAVTHLDRLEGIGQAELGVALLHAHEILFGRTGECRCAHAGDAVVDQLGEFRREHGIGAGQPGPDPQELLGARDGCGDQQHRAGE